MNQKNGNQKLCHSKITLEHYYPKSNFSVIVTLTVKSYKTCHIFLKIFHYNFSSASHLSCCLFHTINLQPKQLGINTYLQSYIITQKEDQIITSVSISVVAILQYYHHHAMLGYAMFNTYCKRCQYRMSVYFRILSQVRLNI